MPEHLAIAVVPGIEAIIELGRRLRWYAGFAGCSSQQFGVQKTPAQPCSEIMSKFTAARPVLAFNGDDTDP